MKRKLIALILAVITVLGTIPAMVYGQVIDKFENDQHWNIIKFDNNSTGEAIYNGFVENTDVTVDDDKLIKPYSSDTVMLLEKSEVFTYMSYNWGVQIVGINDNLHTSRGYLGTDYDLISIPTSENGKTLVNDLCYATGVAFDPTGCGRKNYIAVLGFHNTGSCTTSAAYLYIFNGDTSSLVMTETIDEGNFNWAYKASDKLDLDNVDAGNFFQITAGDYNGDGKDSLVIYDGCATVDCALRQYDFDGKTGTMSSIKLYDGADSKYLGYLNAGWYATKNAGTFWSYSTVEDQKVYGMMHKNLNVCLESGDINGDGIDDLAVVSCTGGLTKEEGNGNISQVATTLAVGFGKKTASTVADLTISKQEIYNNDNGRTPAAPGVSIGDIDGDGDNEVVVAGFCSHPDANKPKNLEDGNVVFAFYKASGTELTLTNGVQTLTTISPISKGDSVRSTQENTWQQFSVECVNFDGSNDEGKKSKDYIFLNGYVYQLDGNNTPQKVSVTGAPDTELFSSVTTNLFGSNENKYDIDEVFIFSAAVGNFIGSANGAEQLTLTVGFKVNEGKSSDADNNGYYLGEVTIMNISGTLQGTLSELPQDNPAAGRTNEGVYVGFNAENTDVNQYYKGGFNGLSYIRVACDIGTDSVIGEYVKTEAFYSDPEVVAVLQAAPYFKELEAGNSSTVYSYSETYGTATTTGYDFTVGFGICAELETSHFKMEVDETIKSSLSEEFEKSIETTYTTEFEANDLNQVILRRKLYYNYIYKIKTYNGQLPSGITDQNDGSICITVLRNPSVTALTFDQYDAYANWYNKKMQENNITDRLNTISKDKLDHYHLLNNEGNPGGYASSLKEYGSSAFSMAKDDTWVQLSNASGTISQQFESAVESAYTQTTSTGVEVNIKAMGGASFAGNGAFAGVQASMEYVSTEASTVSTVNTVTTKGTVQGIASSLSDYGFQWQLIGWRAADSYPMFNSKDVLFVGYLVTDVKSLPEPVSDLKESFSQETDAVTLTWTSPDGDDRPEITDFYIYQDGDYIGTVTNTGIGKTHTFTKDVSDSNTASSEFYILSYVSGTKKKSLQSNVVTSIFAMTKKQTAALIQEMLEDVGVKTDALEQALATKANSDDLAKAIAELTQAYKAADALLQQDIDDAETEIAELEAAQSALKDAMKAADTALQNAIDTVQANLDNAVKDLNDALAAGDQANTDALKKAVSALTEAYKSADALLKSNFESEIASLREAYDQLVSRNDTLQSELNAAVERFDSELEAIRAEMTSQKTQQDESIQALSNVNGEQDTTQHTNRTIAIIGLCISSVSLLCNIGLIAYSLILRKKNPLI